MRKIIHLESHFPTGESTVQPVVLWSRGKPFREAITKYASVGSEYFKTINPIPGHSIVYVIALGSWESWGENKNGDSFPELPYKETEKPPWIAQEDVLTNWYKTFEQFGYNYRHHQNKDPEKAIGKVMKAFWNASMHRVELLIDLDNIKAPDLVQRIEAGEFPPVSMGTRVSYDVCSICGNRSPTRAEYCDHLKFQMRAVLGDGRKVSALNPSPKFFDISWVFKPADQTAYMLKKVAEPSTYELSGAAAGEYLDSMDSRKTAAAKLAVMDKIIQGYPIDAKAENINPSELANLQKMRDAFLTCGDNTPDLPDTTLRSMSQFSLPKILSTLLSSGTMLNTPEVIKIVIYKSSPNTQPDESHLDKSVALQQSVMELFKDMPQLLDQISGNVFNLAPENVEPRIEDLLAPYLEKRSGIPEYLQRRFVPSKLNPETMGLTVPLTLTDPVSGVQYQTTREAAIRAHDEIAKRNLYKIMGGALLLGGAYKLIGSGLLRGGAKKFRPLVALPLAGLGMSQLPNMGPHYLTDQGISIPVTTELAQKSAGWEVPVLGTLATMALLSHDYSSRLRKGIPMGHPALPLSRRILDQIEQTTYEHPLVSALAGPILLRAAGRTKPMMAISKHFPAWKQTGIKFYEDTKKALKGLVGGEVKMSSWLANDLPVMNGTVTLPDIDIDRVAEKIGKLIIEG